MNYVPPLNLPNLTLPNLTLPLTNIAKLNNLIALFKFKKKNFLNSLAMQYL